MPESDRIFQVVREWVEKAENDLRTAAYTLKMDDCPTDTVCFHAQQCVEKYIKAFLTMSEIDFPKTHSIEELMALIPKSTRPKVASGEQDRLTEYATVMRYPGDYAPISLSEARRAVALARRVRKELRKRLAPEGLRRRRK